MLNIDTMIGRGDRGVLSIITAGVNAPGRYFRQTRAPSGVNAPYVVKKYEERPGHIVNTPPLQIFGVNDPERRWQVI